MYVFSSARMNYDLVNMRVLGQGRFGTVYQVDDSIALKVINIGSDQKLKDIAMEEVEWMMKFNRYPAVGCLPLTIQHTCLFQSQPVVTTT